MLRNHGGSFWAIAASVLFVTSLVPAALAQTCPSPAVANNTACTVPPGTIVTVAPANAIGLNALGTLGQITGDGITANLNAAGTTGGLAQSGATITFNGSTLNSTSAAAASIGQTGLRATGIGSTISATGATIALAPTGNSSNLVGAKAENGGTLIFNTSNVRTQTTAAIAIGNDHALWSTGAGSQIQFNGGTVQTLGSRGSFGAFAESGGTITFTGATQISTTGLSIVASLTGSHALYALGTNSVINGTGVVVSTTGTIASGARAENGGTINLTNAQVTVSGASVSGQGSHGLYALGPNSIINATGVTASTSGGSSAGASNGARAENGGALFLTNSTISTSGSSGADTDPNSAVRVMSGGFAQLTGATLTATGLRGDGLSVEGAGSTATMTGSSISVAGTRAPGVFIFNGAAAIVSNSSILSTNNTGVLVQDVGSTISLADTAIRSQGAVGYGLRVILGASATMNGGSITTEGRDGPALYAAAGTILANNVTIVTSGSDNAMGALADLGGTITMNGGSIFTTGNTTRTASFPHGLAARNPGGLLISNGTSVLTQGSVAMGAVADDGGTVVLTGNPIRTIGLSSIGLYATVEQSGVQFPATLTGNSITVETSGALAHGAMATQHFLIAPSVLTLNDSLVTTHGNGAMGLRAIMAATLNSNRTTVSTEGIGANGLQSRDNGSSVNLDLTTVMTTGLNAHGALAEGGGLVVGINSTVHATGGNALGLYVAGAPGLVSNATFTGSSITNVSGPTIGVGGNGNVTLTNSFAGGSGQWLRVGTINDFPPLTLGDTGPPGITDPEGLEVPPIFLPPAALPVVPGLANITLSATTVVGSAFTAPGSVSNVALMNNSHWIMTGNSNLTNLLNDPSFIEFTPPTGDPTLLASYKTLTVVNYIGDGGLIGLNTFLGTDGAPSDRLVIDGGAATGSSPLRITNTTGPGARTFGNGILVVDAINGGTTVTSAFSLAAPVVAGPYAYGLFRSSVDASNAEAWYLRSTIDCSLPGAPSPPCAGPAPEPNYRTEVSLYAAIPAMTLLYGRAVLDTLHERVGEEEDVRGHANPSNKGPSGAWGRVIGMHGHRDGDSIYGAGPTYGYDFLGFQAGTDLYRHQDSDGVRDHAGVYFAFGEARGKVQHFDGSGGNSDFTAFSFGGYWTRFGTSGGYLDAVLQATWYDVTSTANRGVPALNTDGFGIAASLEGGYPFRFDHGFFIEPQAQIVYQKVALNDSSDVANTIVRFGDVDSLAGRIGARFGRTWNVGTQADPRALTAWFRPNLWHEFRGNPRTEFSSADGFIPFRADLGGSWLELNAGVSGQVASDLSLYGNISYHTRFEGDSYAYTGKLGLRKVW